MLHTLSILLAKFNACQTFPLDLHGMHLILPNIQYYVDSNVRYLLMLSCWEMEPGQRPLFTTLVKMISNLLEIIADYLTIDDEELHGSLI